MTTFEIKLKAAARSPASWQLVLDKFPFDHGVRSPVLPERKLDALKPLTAKARVEKEWQAAVAARLAFLELLQRQHGDRLRCLTLVNSSRLLLHLGRPSVLENVGLYCERITGLPVIPGSAVKGLISTWACWDANSNRIYNPALDGTVDLERRRALFDTPAKAVLGDNSDTGSSEGGQIIFLGAFPAKPPQLGLDIVTPHVDAAGHDRNPVPNPFLAIEPGVPWKFLMLVCQRGVTRPAAHLLDTAAAWLTDALAQLGLGAKTAAGYGRFVSPEGFKAGIQVPARPEMALTPAQQAAAAAMARDYPNEAEFANRVLKKLNPGQLDQLKGEIPLLQKPENEQWRAKLLGKLRENKDVRKRLRGKEWFPQEWADI